MTLMVLAIAWSAGFLLVCNDRIRGASSRFFCGRHYHIPHLPPLRWWHHAIRLPFYVVAIAGLLLFCVLILPPIFVVEVPPCLRRKALTKPDQALQPASKVFASGYDRRLWFLRRSRRLAACFVFDVSQQRRRRNIGRTLEGRAHEIERTLGFV